jgi:histidine kinase
MQELPGYTLGERIYSSLNSHVYRATRDVDEVGVFVKILPEEHPSPAKLTRMRREFRMTQGFDDERVIHAWDLHQVGNRLAMVVEDYGASSLDRLLPSEGPHDLAMLLEIAIGAAEALEVVHQRRVMHKDVNPANLVWNPETRQIKIIDFGISTALSRETPSVMSPDVVEGTLAFMSPEQTGRMNRALDYRTDLYSLGATLYWVFTGALPFDAEDPMELVHCHIARVPELADERIPEVVSAIVLKLMAKNAEDRYQSATTLRADLERCLAQQLEQGRIEAFPLGVRDLSEYFAIPQRLYGRDAEIEELLACFRRVVSGGKELMLVAGYSGIGKSALVHEVHKPIVAQRAYFMSGKFDQFNRSVPYASLIEAFRGLMQQLLTESEVQLARWKALMEEAVGVNGQIILDVIPEVALVIGEQGPVAELGPVEAQNRFNFVFAEFVRVFAAPEHPLVVFLDDLQWADGPSLRLIKQFMTDAEASHLFLIGAYRENEVDPSHPLVQTVEEVATAASVSTITLGPLTEEHVRELVSETVHRDPADVGDLTARCLSKTGGNPFFLNRFLHTVYERGGFEPDREAGSWRWDLAAIEAMGITDNVVDLMVRRIRTLPESTQRALQLASCVGAGFDLHTLAIVSERSPVETAGDLWEALRGGLVLPIGGDYKFLEEQAEIGELGKASHIRYRWLHDRVQQAASALIAADDKASVHHRLGRLMLDNLSPEERDEKLFEIVGHLNHGAGLLEDQPARDALAELNLEVGRKAIASMAFAAAQGFLETGLELLGASSWERRYQLTLDLHSEAAHATYLVPAYAETKRHVDAVKQHAASTSEQVRVYEIWILTMNAQGLVSEAITTALEILSLLGVSFPAAPGDADVGVYLQRVAEILGERSIESLIDLPRNSDPEQVAALRIMVNITSTAYIGAPALFPLIVLEVVALSLAGGDTGASAFGYACYAILLCGVIEDFEAGRRFGQLAQRVIAKHDAKEYACRTHYVPNCFVAPWVGHLRLPWASHTESYRLGQENGDNEYSGWAIMKRTHQGFFMGLPLAEAIEDARKWVGVGYRIGQTTSTSYAHCTLQAMLGLRGETEDPCRIRGTEYDEDELIQRYVAETEAFGICNLYVTKAFLCYLWDQWDDVLEQERLIEPWIGGMVALVHIPVFLEYTSLARLAQASHREVDLAPVEAAIARMAKWADHCPENYLHKKLILEGELARVRGEAAAGRDLLAEAIASAKEHGFIQEQALGHELSARSWIAEGERKRAKRDLEQARHLYDVWGATAKARQLEQKHGDFFERKKAAQSGTGTTTHILEELDLATILKANQAISREVQRDGLLRTLLAILIENAGAQSGVLIHESDEGPRVVARGRTGGQVEVVDQAAGAVADLPQGLINLVRRTCDTVVIDDVRDDHRFEQDPYLQQGRTRSVLCVPVEHQGKLVASLYLENDLTPGAFSEGRVKLIEMLLSQVAISLENASLYGSLESLVEQRTRELEQALHKVEAQYELLQEMQDRIVTQEKLASLGVLTAGIAHEIQNPLNFVNSFSELSGGLVSDLFEVLQPELGRLSASTSDEVSELLADIQLNARKIHEHGARAGGIVRGMLEHSGHEGEVQPTDLGRLLELQLRFVLEAHRSGGGPTIDVVRRLEGDHELVELVPRSLAQALRHVLKNACLALTDRCQGAGSDYRPTLTLRTQDRGDSVEIRIRDNGVGIPPDVLDQVFLPFFTTRPAGQGVGLGLSIVHDVVTKLHWGRVAAHSEADFTEVTISLPKKHGAPER